MRAQKNIRQMSAMAAMATMFCALFASTLLTQTAQAASATRTSAFEYDASGLLTKEIIEPDTPQLCLVTACRGQWESPA